MVPGLGTAGLIGHLWKHLSTFIGLGLPFASETLTLDNKSHLGSRP